jgi:threonine dehydratase
LARKRKRPPREIQMTMDETLSASLARLPITLSDIEAAAGVLAGFVERTSFDRSRTLSDITGARL